MDPLLSLLLKAYDQWNVSEGIMRGIALIVSAIALSGCTSAMLIDTQTGQEYRAKVSGDGFGRSGKLRATVDGQQYAGRWIFKRGGGGTAISTGSAFAGGAAGFGTTTSSLISAEGGGRVNIRSNEGNTIRCVFDYNSWSGSGVGDCEGSDGRTYDLFID